MQQSTTTTRSLTDRAGLLTAYLGFFLVADTLFATVVWCRVIAQAFTSLQTASTCETAGVPW